MDNERLFLGFMGSLAAGSFLWWVQSQLYSTYPYQALIDLESTRAIAGQLPYGEDEFITSAWDFVASGFAYEPTGSVVKFINGSLRARDVHLPADTLRRGKANCLGKSALLASILRHRLPAERVWIAIGQLVNGGAKGHVWLETSRGGTFYILESTIPPGQFGWRPAEELRAKYQPEALVNDRERICYSKSLCLVVPKSSVPCGAC